MNLNVKEQERQMEQGIRESQERMRAKEKLKERSAELAKLGAERRTLVKKLDQSYRELMDAVKDWRK